VPGDHASDIVLGNVTMAKLFELRDQLVEDLSGLSGFLTVGIGKHRNRLVFVVSVDPEKFTGGAPDSFFGHDVLVRNLGRPAAHFGNRS
jgi:hypothetical protein